MGITVLIDAGNTRIKIALLYCNEDQYINNYDKKDTLYNHRVSYKQDPYKIEYLGAISTDQAIFTATVWNTILSKKQWVLNKINRMIGVCVAGIPIAECIQYTLAQYIPYLYKNSHFIEWLSGDTYLNGLYNGYAIPETLGADRWLAIYGVFNMQSYKKNPYILATLGTATTVDAVYWKDNHAYFVGGIIIPGLETSWKALHQHTANLPDINTWIISMQSKCIMNLSIPNTTHTALFQGTILAQVGAITLFMNQIKDVYGNPTLYLSGGLTSYVAPYFLEAILLHSPVFDGLAAYIINI